MQIVNTRQEFLNALDLKDKYCVEIGVFRGDFSAMILEKNPLYLYLIDPFEHNSETYGDGQMTTAYSDGNDLRIVRGRFRFQISNKQIMIQKQYSFEAVSTFSDDYFDFIYHDGSHLYKDLKSDLNEWMPKLKKGGIMAGHDYAGVFMDDVSRAVDEFCIENNFEMFLLNKTGGDWALR
jgi:hypothetical protein